MFSNKSGNIPKNRTPFLLPSVFSSGASDKAQFWMLTIWGDCDVTSCFGSPGDHFDVAVDLVQM